MKAYLTAVSATLLLLAACTTTERAARGAATAPDSAADARLAKYRTVRLTTDMAQLTDRDRQVLGLLIDAAASMDSIFWQQAYGNADSLLAAADDEATRQFMRINYGPWDRLANNEPFMDGFGAKPPGANFYPADMTRDEFEAAATGAAAGPLRSQYTLVRRDAAGALQAVPYREA